MKQKTQNGLYVAFDIGTVSIKAAVIEITDTARRLAAIEEESIKPLSAFPGEEEHSLQIVEALKNLAARLPLVASRHTSVLFSHRELQVKIIELPNQIQSDQLEKVINWEAKKLLSPIFREEPYTFSYKVIRTTPFSIALAVIPQRLLEKQLELFEAARINLNGAYCDVFAGQALKDIVDISGFPALSIVNFGHSGTHLQIFSAGELKFYRFIPSGMGEMSTPPKDNELEMYAQKIRFSFDYFRAVSKLTQIDNLYLMGGGAAHPSVLPFTRNYFNPTRINIVDISAGVDISPVLPELTTNTPPEERQRRLMPFIPAAGASLAALSDIAGSMNLAGRLQNKIREKQLERLSRSLPLWCGIAGLLLAVVILLSMKNDLNADMAAINKQSDITRINIDATNIKLARTRSTSERITKLSPPAEKALAPLLNANITPAEALFFISTHKPTGMTIDEILVRSLSEAESITMNDESAEISDPGQATPGETQQTPFSTKLVSADASAQEYHDELSGKILIITGLAENNEQLSSLIEGLSAKKAIVRFKTIISRKSGANGIKFLLKGEMP